MLWYPADIVLVVCSLSFMVLNQMSAVASALEDYASRVDLFIISVRWDI